MNADQLSKLRQALYKKSGLEAVSTTHCREISISIFHRSSDYVSEITLRRIFGLLPWTVDPPLAILDVLARYTGFRDWKSLLQDEELGV